MQKDPEFAPLILEPLKMQGVEQLGDFAVQIRAKMMTLPGEQFVIRRKAYAMIKKAFDENGIKFAFPTGDQQDHDGCQHAVDDARECCVLPGEMHKVDIPSPTEHRRRANDQKGPDTVLQSHFDR